MCNFLFWARIIDFDNVGILHRIFAWSRRNLLLWEKWRKNRESASTKRYFSTTNSFSFWQKMKFFVNDALVTNQWKKQQQQEKLDFHIKHENDVHLDYRIEKKEKKDPKRWWRKVRALIIAINSSWKKNEEILFFLYFNEIDELEDFE